MGSDGLTQRRSQENTVFWLYFQVVPALIFSRCKEREYSGDVVQVRVIVPGALPVSCRTQTYDLVIGRCLKLY
jgi:hypothetical protein